MPTSRLLLLSCSQRKSADVLPVSALERYEGPLFRVLRRYLREEQAELEIWVLSARYGLIRSDVPIENYNQRLTPKRARQLQPQVEVVLREILSREWQAAFVNMGHDYEMAMGNWREMMPSQLLLTTAAGPPGQRAAQLYRWLRT